MKATNLAVSDFFSIPNALLRFLTPASMPATCSFDILWSGPVTDRSHVVDPAVGFAGDFVLSQATMSWSVARSDGFRFVSDPSPTTSAFAQLGQMRNGVFFLSDPRPGIVEPRGGRSVPRELRPRPGS
jgi:hypothetical protein